MKVNRRSKGFDAKVMWDDKALDSSMTSADYPLTMAPTSSLCIKEMKWQLRN
jgi:hypothetical protein